MVGAIAGDSAEQISQAAARQGFRISPRSLWRTSRRGLTPKPYIRSLGRGRGKTTIYPFGTTAQVIAHARLQKRFGRNHKRIGWELWQQGFEVAPCYYERPLRAAGETWYSISSMIARHGAGEEPEFAETLIGTIDKLVESQRLPTRLLGRLRRALKPDLLSTLIGTVFRTIAGYSEKQEDKIGEQLTLLERCLGFSASFKKTKVAQSALEITPSELADMLRLMASAFAAAECDLLDAFSEAETVQARYELKMLFDIFLSVEFVQRQTYGSSTRALQLLRLLSDDFTPTRHAFLLRAWQIVRQIPIVRAGAHELIASVTRPADFRLVTAA